MIADDALVMRRKKTIVKRMRNYLDYICNCDYLSTSLLLISDNILYKGMIADDALVMRRKKTIVKRMRNYLDYICNCDYLSTSLIPIGDGVALSYKEKERVDE